MVGKDTGEELRRVDGMLFGHYVGGLFHGVGGHDDAVVCFCVGRGDVSFQEDADYHLVDGVRFRGFIADHLIQTNVVFAIASCCDRRHDEIDLPGRT